MGSKKSVHALGINPGPTELSPTFRGSSSILCNFPSCQFRISELALARVSWLCGFFHHYHSHSLYDHDLEILRRRKHEIVLVASFGALGGLLKYFTLTETQDTVNKANKETVGKNRPDNLCKKEVGETVRVQAIGFQYSVQKHMVSWIWVKRYWLKF